LGDKFGIALVAKVKGDASEVWAKVDKAKSNQLEFEEVRTMLIHQLGFSPEQCTDDEVMAMVRPFACLVCVCSCVRRLLLSNSRCSLYPLVSPLFTIHRPP